MASELKHRLMSFWAARNPRERMVLSAGGGILLVLLWYGLVYRPIYAAHQKLTVQLPELRAQQRLMVSQVDEIERLRRESGARPIPDINLQARIQASLNAANLQDAMISITPVGKDVVQVVTRERPVSVWMGWLFDLQRQGVRVGAAQLRVSGKEGQARLEVSFTVSSP